MLVSEQKKFAFSDLFLAGEETKIGIFFSMCWKTLCCCERLFLFCSDRYGIFVVDNVVS